MKLIEDIVKKRILELKISSAKFSRQCGFQPTYLNKIYRLNSTSIDTLEKMAKVLGINVGNFFEPVSKDEEPSSDYTIIK
ncbi:helix-turn-helix domain-containing protein, partial [Emticicia sp.]|uniref:helix-turn-helix domain-containing protein n=1 Tax=Emticicia sp. TaxID=1930953 RepID=UPI00374FDEE0